MAVDAVLLIHIDRNIVVSMNPVMRRRGLCPGVGGGLYKPEFKLRRIKRMTL